MMVLVDFMPPLTPDPFPPCKRRERGENASGSPCPSLRGEGVGVRGNSQILPAEPAATTARPAEEALTARLQDDDIAQLQSAHDFAVHIIAQAEFDRNRFQAAV